MNLKTKRVVKVVNKLNTQKPHVLDTLYTHLNPTNANKEYCKDLKKSKFGKLSFKYSSIINELSREHDDNSDSSENQNSISEESDNLLNIKKRVVSNVPYADIPASLHDEQTTSRKLVPTFHATVRKGWNTERIQNVKIEESKSYEK